MKVQIECFGVTRKTQVLRILNYQMLSNQMETQLIEFETDAMALAVEWGDVIQFNHDVMPRKQPFLSAEPLESGRVLAGSSPTALHLDRAVTWGPYNRRVQIQSLADDLIRNARVNEPDGTVSDFPAVTGLGGYTPAEGDVWTAEPEFIDSPPPNKWKVIGVTRTQDGHARVRAVIYRDEMFNALTGVDAIMLAQV
jgi:predicted phage tail protein